MTHCAGSIASYRKVPWPGSDAGLPISPVADGEILLYCDAGCTLREGSSTTAEWERKELEWQQIIATAHGAGRPRRAGPARGVRPEPWGRSLGLGRRPRASGAGAQASPRAGRHLQTKDRQRP